MNSMKSKLLLVSFLIMAMNVAPTAAAFAFVPPPPPPSEVIVGKLTGGGWYLTEAPYSTYTGHRASFGVEAGRSFEVVDAVEYRDNSVKGHGSFMDNDYRLKAILTVTGGTIMEGYDGAGTYWVGLKGIARIYVDNVKAGEMVFHMAFAVHPSPGDRTDRVWFEIPALGYKSWGDLIGGNVNFHT